MVDTIDPDVLTRVAAQAAKNGKLSPRAAAPLLGLHWQTVLKYIRSGDIRAIEQTSGRFAITLDEIDRYNKDGSAKDLPPIEPAEDEPPTYL